MNIYLGRYCTLNNVSQYEGVFVIISVDNDNKTCVISSNNQTYLVNQSEISDTWGRDECPSKGGSWIDYNYVKNNKPTNVL